MTEERQTIIESALQELEHGARDPQTIAHRFNMTHRKQAVVNGREDEQLTREEVITVLDPLVSDGLLVKLDDPDGWYQLADWNDRPPRVLSVSHHITEIEGVSQIDHVWLDESLRAARHEHGIDEQSLQGLPTDDDRQLYLISTRHYDVLEQYRETLQRLATDLHGSNNEKAMLYERLADATNIEDQFETREREVGLRA